MTFSVIGIDTKTGQRVDIFKLSRLLGLYVIGMQRMGKSGLFEELIIQDIKQGIGVCVLDPHGELIDHVIARLRNRAEEEKVILLDITDEEHPFGLNLLACSNPTNDSAIMNPLRQVLHTFDKAYGISPTTPLMYDLLYKIAYVLIANPGYTMVDIPLFLTNEACRKKLVHNVSSPEVRTFWERWDDPKQKLSKEQEADSRTILNKLNDFSHAPLRNIIGQSSSTINLQEIMDAGKALLIKLSRQLEQATSLIGSINVALTLNAADTRITNKLFNLYADEFQNFATEDFAVLLEQSSKRAIGVTMAHQNRAQLETSDKQAEANLRVRTLSVGNLIVFRVPTDAHELAGQFDITPAPERLEEIEKEELIGHRPVRAYKGDVIGHLLHQGHEDERVRAFVKGCLEILHLASLKKVVHPQWWINIYPQNYLGIEYNPERIPEILTELNTWLFAGMRDRNTLWQSLPDATFRWLASFFGFGELSDAYYSQKYTSLPWMWIVDKYDPDLKKSSNLFDRPAFVQAAVTAVEDSLIDFVAASAQPEADIRRDWQQTEFVPAEATVASLQARGCAALSRITGELRSFAATQPALDSAMYECLFLAELSRPEYALDVFLPLVLRAGHQAQREFIGKDGYTIARSTLEFSYVGAGLKQVYIPDSELYKLALYRGITEKLPSYLSLFLVFLRFMARLHCAQLALSQSPILTMDSGEYEPEKRTQTHYITHPQRPYQDMLNEVAKELVRLPKYTAQVKLTDENDAVVEYRITTMKPGTGLYGKPFQERLDRIRERNMKDGYLRERTAVEAEIRRRQEQWREPPADEPPVSRRPPR